MIVTDDGWLMTESGSVVSIGINAFVLFKENIIGG